MKPNQIFNSILAVLFVFPLMWASALQAASSGSIEVITTFDYPGTGNQTLPQKINDKGDVVGEFIDSNGVVRGFVRFSNGSFSAPIVDPNDTVGFTEGRGINNSGTVAGDYANGTLHSFFLSGGTFTEYDVPGAVQTNLLSIGEPIAFTGGFDPDGSGVFQAFVSVGGTLTAFSVPGALSTFAYETNNSKKLVVGYFIDSSGVLHGYFRDANDALHFPIDPSGSTATVLFGVNNKNWVVGRYADSSGVTHAAARHGAKAQERGTLMQAGLAAAQIGAVVGGVDANLASLVLQGAGAGAQMIQLKYGREQELEADKYGMKYMKLTGYDPQGAVTLQETFVRLFSNAEKNQDWMSGLFASHPPSAERVEQNKQTAQELGPGGEVGKEIYIARVKPLLDMKPAYDKYDEAMAAAQKGDIAKAKSLAIEAANLQPKEGIFQQLQGEIALNEKKPKEARAFYEKAIALNPNYFGSYLGAGVAEYRAGDKAKAEQYLTQSAKLLPTAPAAYFLGAVAKDKGDTETALKYYQAAATSNSNIGQAAAAEALRIDLPRNPGNYVASAPRVDEKGRVVAVVENRAPLPLTAIQLTPVLVDASGNIVRQAEPIKLSGTLQPGERGSVDTGIGSMDQQTFQGLRFRVDKAQAVEPPPPKQ